LELIESARPASFVERFLARRGEGMHHLSIDVEESRLGAYAAALEGSGLRIVDRGDYGNGDETAFISPRTAPRILVQFWQGEGFHHLAIDVDRLDVLVRRLEVDGIELVGKADIPGGRRTAFIHPRHAHGTLIQFWEEPEFGGPRRS